MLGSGHSPGLAGGQSGPYEDAERVSRRVGIHEQWLIRIVGAIDEQACAERKRPLMLGVQVIERRHGGIEMQHLWPRALWPGGLRQARHLLECQTPGSISVAEHQPVLAPGIGSAVRGQFVTGAIVKAQ